MPEKYVPRHRNEPTQRVRAGAKNAVLYSGVAVFATSLSVGAGITRGQDADSSTGVSLAAGTAQAGAGEQAAPSAPSAALSGRTQGASRAGGDRLSPAARLKAAELSTATGVAVTRTEKLSVSDPKSLARALMPQYGLSSAEFDCLDNLWTGESNWNVRADNPSSSAYGIPQALPGSKMATAGSDWRSNPETQIRWGLGYIANRYDTACSAWSFKRSHGYY
ncbi:MAG: lytic transglycosylase domain-containing protein [Propionibacteriales bacterium]|nr:lytic transglycosylase domain-containing protein [Propionibacteriales bacterium]